MAQPYITPMDDPSDDVGATGRCRRGSHRRGTRASAGWYHVDLKVAPHFKYEGADFTLSLVGKLDKKAS